MNLLSMMSKIWKQEGYWEDREKKQRNWKEGSVKEGDREKKRRN